MSELSSPGRLSRFFFEPLFSRKEREAFEEMEESDGERAAGTDTAEERAIRAMPIVTALSYVRAVKDKARGVRVTLTCYNCREYGSCEKPQEAPIHLTKERTTMHACLQEMHACLQELRKRLQQNHGNCAEALTKKAAADAASAATVSPDTPNVLQAMMQLEQAKSRAEAANKLALEAEKERDAAEKAVEELESTHS